MKVRLPAAVSRRGEEEQRGGQGDEIDKNYTTEP
jgi:hypothetical protein